MTSKSKHFDISQLPSLKEGMTIEDEAMKRRKTCRFIEEAGRVLKLPRVAVSTAEVFFHRFYAKHSFNDHERFEVAVACIVLAAKTEESPRKLNNVIDECYKLKLRGIQAGRLSAAPGSGQASPFTALDPKSKDFAQLKQRILLLERVILHTIGFELSIDHPYKFLVELIKKLVYSRKVEYIKPTNLPGNQLTSKLLNELVQNAMNFANDSMQTCLCLQFPPKEIAVATVYLAGNFAKVRPVGAPEKDWLDILGNPDVESLASVCLQIIELIVDRKGVDRDAFQKIKAEINRLKSTRGGDDAGKQPPGLSDGPDPKRRRLD